MAIAGRCTSHINARQTFSRSPPVPHALGQFRYIAISFRCISYKTPSRSMNALPLPLTIYALFAAIRCHCQFSARIQALISPNITTSNRRFRRFSNRPCLARHHAKRLALPLLILAFRRAFPVEPCHGHCITPLLPSSFHFSMFTQNADVIERQNCVQMIFARYPLGRDAFPRLISVRAAGII